MIPSKDARQVAASAQSRFGHAAPGTIASKIAAGAILTPEDVAKARAFFAKPIDSDQWRLAAAMTGGAPMASQLHAAGPPAEPKQITASSEGSGELDRILCDLDAKLFALDQQCTSEIRGTVNLAFRTALDKVGRMVTREADTEGIFAELEASDVAIVTPPADLARINVDALVAPVLADVRAAAFSVFERWQHQAIDLVERALFVEFDAGELGAQRQAADAGAQALVINVRRTLTARLASANAVAAISDTERVALMTVPQGDIVNATAIAAGATSDGDGRPLRNSLGLATNGVHSGSNGIGQGPASNRLVTDALQSHRNPVVSAAASPRPGARISGLLREELANVAKVVRTWTWHREALGPVDTPFPGHEDLDGKRFTEEELESLDARPQSPHESCKCSLELTRSADFS